MGLLHVSKGEGSERFIEVKKKKTGTSSVCPARGNIILVVWDRILLLLWYRYYGGES